VLRRNAAGEHVIVEDAKSEAGVRRVKLDAETSAMICRRMARVDGDGLVLTTRTGHGWHNNNFRDRYWNPAVTAANLARKPTPHWLRHTSVAWLVMTGKVSLPEIQRRIGHESIQTTINVYGRMIDDVSPEALDAFAALRGGWARQLDT
jgi:integrase